MPKEWKLYNGYGRFNVKNNEYEILNTNTPVPWSNVLSNKRFGTIISTHGTVYSFFKNASEYKISSWCNDWSHFAAGETFKGIYDTEYNLTYGLGYVKVSEVGDSIAKDMDIFIPMEDDLKIQYISLKNNSTTTKEITISYKVDLVLGVAKEMTNKYLLSKFVEDEDYLVFKNSYSNDFSNVCCYLKAFLYDNSENAKVEYNVNEAKVEITLELKPRKKTNFAIVLGAVENYNDISNILLKYANKNNVIKEFKNTKKYFTDICVKKINTGNENLDIIASSWLLYQTIACRLYARSSLYQAGGAYGFRDQLQDTLALINVLPALVKDQIKKHASKQFEKGDVLHWWHEQNGAGIRTYFSDDYLWLPYTVSEYIEKTNDFSILKEEVPYLENKEIPEDKEELYEVFKNTEVKENIYYHCLKAIKYGLSRKGKSGLLSIGSGDWNDGFSSIHGESVWLTFFMMDILKRFVKIANVMNDEVNEMHFKSERHVLKHVILDKAYKNGYFIRAFYADSTPIGSYDSDDCKIDLISQAWAAIALGDYPDCKEEILSALKEADKYLVDRKNKIVKLLYPPFDNPIKNPGYIKAYVPGVRENGGQYTHAAIWLAKAYFEINRPKKGLEILDMINPINHSDTKKAADIYKVEPFVLAADVYANEEHIGRGGWTWYTGSSAWMYKVIEDNFKKEKKNIKKKK